MFFAYLLACLVWLEIGYRIGHASQRVWLACAKHPEASGRKSFMTYALFPTHARNQKAWGEDECPIFASHFESPELYGLFLALFWPVKTALNLVCFTFHFLAGPHFLRIVDALFRPERFIAGAASKEAVEPPPPPVSTPVPDPPSVSPAARIEEIKEQMAVLADELTTLEKRPDATRL